MVWNQRELSAYRYPSGVPQTETAKVRPKGSGGGERKGRVAVEEKRENVRGECLPRYFKRSRQGQRGEHEVGRVIKGRLR